MSIKENVWRTTGGDMILDVVNVVEDDEEVMEEVRAVVVLASELALVCSRMEGVIEEEETGRVVGCVASTWFPSQLLMVSAWFSTGNVTGLSSAWHRLWPLFRLLKGNGGGKCSLAYSSGHIHPERQDH